MKKILLSILCIVVALVAFAQVPATATDSASVVTSTIQTDTLHRQLTVADAEEFKAGETHFLRTDEDGEFVVYNGVAYKVGDVMEAAFDRGAHDEYVDRIDYKRSKMDAIIRIVTVSVGFVVPCITIIIALIVLMIFFMKRNSARNGIISKAIDNNYQLPDAFYTGYSAQGGSQSDGSGMTFDADGNDVKLFGLKAVPQASRDPKMFVSAMTLIAIGFAILLFFSFNHEIGVGFLCGGIPLFLGIGRMIAYYYVPGAYKQRNFRNPQNSQNPQSDFNRVGGRPTPQGAPNAYWQQPQAPRPYVHVNEENNQANNGQQNFNGPCPPPTPSDSTNQGGHNN